MTIPYPPTLPLPLLSVEENDDLPVRMEILLHHLLRLGTTGFLYAESEDDCFSLSLNDHDDEDYVANLAAILSRMIEEGWMESPQEGRVYHLGAAPFPFPGEVQDNPPTTIEEFYDRYAQDEREEGFLAIALPGDEDAMRLMALHDISDDERILLAGSLLSLMEAGIFAPPKEGVLFFIPLGFTFPGVLQEEKDSPHLC